MMVNLVICCLLVVIFVLQFISADHMRMLCSSTKEPCFTYDPHSYLGPSCWFSLGTDNKCCDEMAGKLQSPIDIPRPSRWFNHFSNLRYVPDRKYRWDGDDDDDGNGYYYNRRIVLKGRLENNGIYPKFVPDHDNNVALINVPGSTRNHRYILENIHIHSGKKGDYRQTENLLYGESFDAEAHIVHYREDYGGITEASKHSDGIVVVSIFLSGIHGRRSSAFKKIFQHLIEIIEYDEPDNVCATTGNTTIVNKHHQTSSRCDDNSDSQLVNDQDKCLINKRGSAPCGTPVNNIVINPNNLLPKIPVYLMFDGGLTTPTCSEAVKWLVATNPTRINNLVPLVLATIETRIEGETIGQHGNLRPLQNVAGRTVTKVMFRRRRCWWGDDDGDDDEKDDERECDDDRDDDDDDDIDDDRDDDDRRRNKMKLDWSINWKGLQNKSGYNVEKRWK